ncbi:zinc ribbon domain-containing protein [Clostridioides difficile]|nr:zinc ribbon domain-containing protein [Clostridioides difficile]NJK12901.1 zinc ribbon domain-containing protein [Clostridioides difficile]
MDEKKINNMNYSHNNYSKTTGELTRKIKNNNFTLKKKEEKICPSCSKENNSKDNYCKFCGNELYEVASLKPFETKLDLKSKIKELSHHANTRGIFLTTFTNVFILFIIALIFKAVITIQFNDISYLINPAHIILALNLGQISVSMSTMMGSGFINANIGLLILLIIPILGLIISNLIFMRKRCKDSKTTLANSLGVGILYGLILAVLSVFTNVKTGSHSMLEYGYALEYSYQFFSVLLNGFVLGFICTYITNYKKSYEKENMYMSLFSNSIKIFILGYVLVLAILFVLTISDSSYLNELDMSSYSNGANLFAILPQIASYMWAFANGISVTIINSTVSIFSLGSSSLFGDTKLMFYAMGALSALILLLNGYKLRFKYDTDNIKPVIVFSVYYAFLMGMLALFSTFILDSNINFFNTTSYGATLIMQFKVFQTIIISFIYSFVISLIGYKLNSAD